MAIYSTSKISWLELHLPSLWLSLLKAMWNLGIHKAKMRDTACAAFQKGSNFFADYQNQITNVRSLDASALNFLLVNNSCERDLQHQPKCREQCRRLCKSMRTAQDWAQLLLWGMGSGGTEQPGFSKSLFTFLLLFLFLLSPPSSFPLLLVVAILGTQNPRQRYLGSLLVLFFFQLGSYQTWSPLPRSTASHSKLYHWKRTCETPRKWLCDK